MADRVQLVEWEAIANVAGIGCNTVVLVVFFAAEVSANTLFKKFIIDILQYVGCSFLVTRVSFLETPFGKQSHETPWDQIWETVLVPG